MIELLYLGHAVQPPGYWPVIRVVRIYAVTAVLAVRALQRNSLKGHRLLGRRAGERRKPYVAGAHYGDVVQDAGPVDPPLQGVDRNGLYPGYLFLASLVLGQLLVLCLYVSEFLLCRLQGFFLLAQLRTEGEPPETHGQQNYQRQYYYQPHVRPLARRSLLLYLFRRQEVNPGQLIPPYPTSPVQRRPRWTPPARPTPRDCRGACPIARSVKGVLSRWGVSIPC